MNRILIYGAPGAGKTTTSKLLHKKTGIFLYEGDYLREVIAQEQESEEENHFLYVGTKQAWRKFGSLTNENVIKGLHAVRAAMSRYISGELAKHHNIIFEAAFLDPNRYSGTPMYLIVTLDEAKHRSQYFEHREETLEIVEGFTAARIIQAYLVNEAKMLNIPVVDNDDTPEHLVGQFEI